MKKLTTTDLYNRVFALINPEGQALEKLHGKHFSKFCFWAVMASIVVWTFSYLIAGKTNPIMWIIIAVAGNVLFILMQYQLIYQMGFSKNNLEELLLWRRAKSRIISQCYGRFIIACQLVDDSSPMPLTKFMHSEHLLELKGCYQEILGARALATQARDNHRAELRLHQAQVAVRGSGFRKF